jgi:hypothetical protein
MRKDLYISVLFSLMVIAPVAAQTVPAPQTTINWLRLVTTGNGISNTFAASVPEGYLVKTVSLHGDALTFVPDPHHLWNPLSGGLYSSIFDGTTLTLTGAAGESGVTVRWDAVASLQAVAATQKVGAYTSVKLINGQEFKVGNTVQDICDAVELFDR